MRAVTAPSVAVFGFSMLWLIGCSQVGTTVQDSASIATPAPVTPPPVTTPVAIPNSAPIIRGQPVTTIVAGAAYSFTPSASDNDGDTLTFSIENKPSWAAFNSATGALTGTTGPADVNVYANILIHVSDGKDSTSLSPFTLNVVGGNGGNNASGTAALSWTVPTQNTDGTPLTDLAGYWIYYGRSAVGLVRLTQINSPLTTQYLASALASGTHFFAISAYNSAGAESPLTSVGSKIVP